MNIFEQATRQALSFATTRGMLTTQDLWQVPLRSKNGFDLDAIAKACNATVKEFAEESFVDKPVQAAGKKTAELALEVVKHIIAVKLEEEAWTAARASKIKARERILQVMAEKQDEGLKAMSLEELTQELNKL